MQRRKDRARFVPQHGRLSIRCHRRGARPHRGGQAMKEVFIQYQPRAATLAVIDQANTIIDEYFAQGFTLTLRQLFYQFVSRALLENTLRAYKTLIDQPTWERSEAKEADDRALLAKSAANWAKVEVLLRRKPRWVS